MARPPDNDNAGDVGGTSSLPGLDALFEGARVVPANDPQAAARAERSAAASLSSRVGAYGEQVARSIQAGALLHHIAVVTKIPTPTRWRSGRLVYAERSICDDLGYVLDGTGRHVAEEVKTCTTGDAFAMSRVKAHQRDYLEMAWRANCIARLLLIFGELAGDRLVNWHAYSIPWVWARTRTSISERDARPFAVGAHNYLLSAWTSP